MKLKEATASQLFKRLSSYAATIHKAQGVTVDRAYLLASRYLDGHATYMGLSRHRESANVFYSREEFMNERLISMGSI